MINQIHNENCLDTMKRMPDHFIDLTVTSPPYDNLRDYKGYSFDFENIARELYRVTKEGGVLVWVVGDATINGSETGTSFRQALFFKEIGFNLHDTMIYHKNCLSFPDHVRYYQCFEYMFVLSKGTPKAFNPIIDKKNRHFGKRISGGDREASGDIRESSGSKKGSKIKRTGVRFNIWKYNTGWMHSYTEEYLKGHSAIFPMKLAVDHVLSWSNHSDLVYDPFMGSGTTAVAAIKHSRQFVGSEISKEYYKISERRITSEQSQMKLF